MRFVNNEVYIHEKIDYYLRIDLNFLMLTIFFEFRTIKINKKKKITKKTLRWAVVLAQMRKL